MLIFSIQILITEFLPIQFVLVSFFSFTEKLSKKNSVIMYLLCLIKVSRASLMAQW